MLLLLSRYFVFINNSTWPRTIILVTLFPIYVAHVGPRHIILLSNYSLITQIANTIFIYHCILNELFNLILFHI